MIKMHHMAHVYVQKQTLLANGVAVVTLNSAGGWESSEVGYFDACGAKRVGVWPENEGGTCSNCSGALT